VQPGTAAQLKTEVEDMYKNSIVKVQPRLLLRRTKDEIYWFAGIPANPMLAVRFFL